MTPRNAHRKSADRNLVAMAVAAVEDSGCPLGLDTGDADTAPTALGLPTVPEPSACSHHRYVCAVCGKPLRRRPE